MPLAFPDFRGATRKLVLSNLAAYFALLLLTYTLLPLWAKAAWNPLSFSSGAFLHGALWQPFTYSFINLGILPTLFELLSLFFVAGFLETYHRLEWVVGLYCASVLGAAAAALALDVCGQALGHPLAGDPLTGCFGGIFGLLAAIGVIHGDVEFLLFPLPIGIKARYLVVVYALVSVAMLFGSQRLFAFAQLGGALAGLLYLRLAPRQGLSLGLSEQWYGLRNRYYRWKRRRAARKFEVYMRRHGRNVRLDSQGRQIDDDDANDKSRWN